MAAITPIHQLLGSPLLWRGRQPDASAPAGIPSRHARLDALLPGGGWPPGSLIELIANQIGIGELALLLPGLAALTENPNTAASKHLGTRRQIVLIDPPYLPYAPGLMQAGLKLDQLWWISTERPQDAAWSCEQSLRSGSCAAVLYWPAQALPDKTLRRLQLAAEQGQSLGFLFRDESAWQQTSPAAVRLQLRRQTKALQLELRKCRGISGRTQLQLEQPG